MRDEIGYAADEVFWMKGWLGRMVRVGRSWLERTVNHRAFLGLGTNLGDRRRQLLQAVNLLAECMAVELLSSVYDTAPMQVVDQPRFLNLVCSVRTDYTPENLLRLLKSIERRLGRVAGPRFGPRAIDIDLLFYDTLVLESPTLTVPHPRIPGRAFVLLPLAEIAPTLEHPVLHVEIATMAEAVSPADVIKLGPLFTPTG
ncbi:MAG: 2-amino-4-hydroxy-6-hydroxymethyldihydropteridine diphosphokinase [Ktedonobacterales bacterium]